MPEPKEPKIIDAAHESREKTPSIAHETKGDAVETAPESEDQKGVDRDDARRRLMQLRNEEATVKESPAVATSASIAAYVEKYLPKHLLRPSVIAPVANAVLRLIERVQNFLHKREFVGKEHFPADGPYIIIANHSRANDPHTITLLSGRPLRTAAADIHFSNPISAWFHKAVGLFEVRSSLTNLTQEEKSALIKRVPKHEQAYYKKAAERAPDMADVRRFARETSALLARGDAVTIFPEGLWLFEGNVLRKAYPGIELVAREYKRLTGKDIPIVPVALSDNRVVVEEPMILQPGDDVHTIMRKIAAELPEEERGFYK